MTGFLQHLVERTLAPRLGLRPRPMQRFEAHAEPAAAGPEADADFEGPAPQPPLLGERPRHRDEAPAPRPATPVRGKEAELPGAHARGPLGATVGLSPPDPIEPPAQGPLPSLPSAAPPLRATPHGRTNLDVEAAPTHAVARPEVPAWSQGEAAQQLPRAGQPRSAHTAPALGRTPSVVPSLTPLPAGRAGRAGRATPERLASVDRAGVEQPSVRFPAKPDVPWLVPVAEAAATARRCSESGSQDVVPAPHSTAVLPMRAPRVPVHPAPAPDLAAAEPPEARVPQPHGAPRRAAAVVPAPRPMASPDAARAPLAQAAAHAPVVQVTIGRIEIRAAAPAPGPAPAARRAGPHKPAVSLGDYLRQRQGGGG